MNITQMLKKSSSLITRSALMLAVLGLIPSVAQAANGTWNADASGNWSDTTKWSPAAVPGTSAGDVVGLTSNLASVARTVTIDTTSRIVGTLSIGDPTTSFYAYTLAASGGADLTFNNNGSSAILSQTLTTAADLISAPLTLADNLVITNTSSGGLTLSGAISDGGAGKSLTKTGSGTLTLSGVNTYSGGSIINAGTVAANGATGAIGTGSITINSGGTLRLPFANMVLDRALTLNGGTLYGNGDVRTVSGTIALTANSTLHYDQSNFGVGVVNSAISGAGGLTKTGNGVWRFTNASNTYTGPTVISAGGIAVTQSLYGNDTSKWIPSNITVATNAVLGMHVGGSGEFTMGQVATMFGNLTTSVNNNGLRPGAIPTIYTLNAPAGTYTYSAVLADSTGTGGGAVNFKLFGTANTTLELTGANTYSGVTLIDNNGTLKVSSFNSVNGGNPPMASSSLGRPTTVANGTIWLGVGGWNGNGTLDTTYSSGNLTYIGTGETTDRVLGLFGYGGTKNYTLDQSGTGLLKFTSNLAGLSANTTHNIILTGSTAGTGEFAGVLINPSGGTTTITKNGSGTWTLSGANLYTGVTTVNGGCLVLANANALNGGIGATGGLGALTFNGGVIGLSAGNFSRTLAAANTIGAATFSGNGGWAAYGADRIVNLGGASASITWATASTGFNAKTLILGNVTATHTVDFQNPLALGTASCTVQVDDGAAAIDGKLSGILSGGAGGTLTKTGYGTLALTGANTYPAATIISAGTLLVNGYTSCTGAVSVSTAGAVLGGTGTVLAAVSVVAGGAINLRDGAVGTLNLGSLTLSGSATSPNSLAFELGNAAGGTDKIVLTGAHSANTANGALVSLNQLPGTVINSGTYTLIQGGVGVGNNLTGYTLVTTRAGRNVYSGFGASGSNLVVTVNAGDSGPADAFTYWKGNASSVWTGANWYSDADGTTLAATPGYSSNIRFATTGAGNLANTLGQDFEINSLTVDSGLAATSISGNMLTIGATADNGNAVGNGITIGSSAVVTIASKVGLASSQTWTVGSGASLTNSGVVSDFGGKYALTKAGSGTLTLAGVNTFGGAITISEGTLTIGGAGQLNSGTYAVNIVNNGIFNYSSSANQTLSGVMSGTGALAKGGTGTLTINNSANSFTGPTTVNAGTLTVGSTTGALGTGTPNVTVQNGATLNLSLGGLVMGAGGTLYLNGGTLSIAVNGATPNWQGAVVLNANSTILTASSGGGGQITGNISGTGGITKTGADRLHVNSVANSFSGPTIVNAGILQFKYSLYGNDPLQWIPANITVASNAVLRLNVGGPGEFTVSQFSTLFTGLTTVNNNGFKNGAYMGIDTGNAGVTVQTISATLTDSTGPGGGSVGIRYIGAGPLQLTGANTYSGQTCVDVNGTLKVSSLNSVSSNPGLGTIHSTSSNLGAPTTIANGTIVLGGADGYFNAGNLTYTGTGEITDRVISLGGSSGGGNTYTFDQSGTGLLKFISAFTIGDNRYLKVINLQGSTSGSGEIAGVLPVGSAATANSLTKNGTGTWTLSAANLYGGVTTVNGGALVLAHATALLGGIGATGGASALTFNGGVIGLGAGDFTRSLNTAGTTNAATFTGNGGWAAYGADRVVNLGGASVSITWATASTGFNAKTLILGNATATHTVDFQNPIDMGNAARTVQADKGAAAVDGKLSGIIAGIAGGNLSKTGLGTLALTGANTYIGTTTVSSGTLLVNGAISNGVVTVNSGATLGGSGAIGGNVTFSSGSSAVFTPGSTLAIAGTLSTANNVVHLNLPAKLNGGVYILATYKSAGSTGTFATVPVAVTGTLPDGATIITENGLVKLNVPLRGTIIVIF